jgi:hypothetical protein
VNIHPAIIEKARREREQREQESRRLPLHAPRPLPLTPMDDAPPAKEQGIVTIDFIV